MNIAVTGGMGFIGSYIIEKLLLDGHSVMCVDYHKTLIMNYEKNKFPIIERFYKNSSHSNFLGIESPLDFLEDKFSYSRIVHAGACVNTMNMGDELLMYRNVDYIKGMMMRNNKTGKQPPENQYRDAIVFLSSAAVYGSNGYPNNPYGLTKCLGEKLVANYSSRFTILRLFNVFGPDEDHKGEMASVLWRMTDRLKRGKKFGLFSENAKRDFIPVHAVASAVAASVSAGGPNGVYDVGTGTATSFLDAAKLIGKINDTDCKEFIEIVNHPAHLHGRYQEFTQAGSHGSEKFYNDENMTSNGVIQYYGE